MTEQKLRELLDDLSLEEKIGQLVQIPGWHFEDSAAVTGGDTQADAQLRYKPLAGSTLGVLGAEKLRALQESYMANHPHHIPMLFMLDVVHGLRTVFPIPLAQGGGFDPALAEECARAAALEAAVSGIHVTFAPMCDLVRDSRWGRVMESPGEDPLVNGLMAQAMVKGFQGEHCGEKDRIAACIKHFAAYGAAVAGLDYQNVELSEQTLREFYLPAYEKGIRAGAELVMTSFNLLNGVPASGNPWLLNQVLRREMGFDGVLISDWGSIGEMVPHGYCADLKEAAEKAIHCGVDIDMCSGAYAGHLQELIAEGKVDISLIDRAVWRVLVLKNKLGLFENPFKDADAAREKELVLCKAHRELARRAARETAVLLKNDGILPLNPGEKAAFIGPFAADAPLHGGWAIVGRDEDTVKLKDVPIEGAVYLPGCTLLDNGMVYNTGSYWEEDHEAKNAALLQQALEAAKSADKVILCLGEHRMQTGEAASRADTRLPGVQRNLLEQVARVNPSIALVIFSGRPLELTEQEPLAKAILYGWMPGSEGGPGLNDLLTGVCSPKGSVPMSFPRSVGQLPMSYNHMRSGRPARNPAQPFVTRYLDVPNTPLYPFGHGLGYTEFTLSPIRQDRSAIAPGETLTAKVTLTNTGRREGTATVQLYIHDVTASRVRPVRELAAWQQMTLNPGEERELTFQLREEMLRFPNAQGFASEKGKFEFWIGLCSDTDNGSGFELL